MDKEKGKRKLQENSKRKEQRKITTRWKPIFWTQEPARMADCVDHNGSTDVSTTPLLGGPQHQSPCSPCMYVGGTHLLLVVALTLNLHHGHLVLLSRGVKDGRLGKVRCMNVTLCKKLVLRIRIGWRHRFLGRPNPDPLVRDIDPDPDTSIIMQKVISKKTSWPWGAEWPSRNSTSGT
jgi:hypothetical protein